MIAIRPGHGRSKPLIGINSSTKELSRRHFSPDAEPAVGGSGFRERLPLTAGDGKMEKIISVDWSTLFIPTHSLAEMIIRGSIMYIGLFVILRFIMKRQAGAIGMADILVIVVIADAAQNGFAREYRSVTEGLVLVLTVIAWDFAIDWLTFRFPAMSRILDPSPVPLISNGKVLRRNLRREYITQEELDGHLRKAGVADAEEVESAHMEADGEISVVKRSR
jgi:hypothetical protein